MSDEEQEQPPANAGPHLATSFGRVVELLRSMVGEREGVAAWIASWMPLVSALKGLALTAAKVLWQARKLATDGDVRLVDDDALAELRDRFDELVETFPDATAFFFGLDNVDTLVGDVLDDGEARGTVMRFARAVEQRMNEVIGRLVEWGLEDGAHEINLERLEAFVRGLEGLLQDVLDRWVLPRLYDENE